MKFSILISSYNKGNYIEKCIKSCLAQSNKNLEIIVVDNYSGIEKKEYHLETENAIFNKDKYYTYSWKKSGCGLFTHLMACFK